MDLHFLLKLMFHNLKSNISDSNIDLSAEINNLLFYSQTPIFYGFAMKYFIQAPNEYIPANMSREIIYKIIFTHFFENSINELYFVMQSLFKEATILFENTGKIL